MFDLGSQAGARVVATARVAAAARAKLTEELEELDDVEVVEPLACTHLNWQR